MAIATWLRRLREEAAGFFDGALPPTQAGLSTYRIELNGGQRRLHLRVAQDGSGVLFVDVTEAIHLNRTATQMAKLALDQIPFAQARRGLLRSYRGVDKARLTQELSSMYEMVERLRTPGLGCPVCAIEDDVEFRPLFSTPVQAPYKVDIALSYACNNACPHCYNEADRLTMHTLSMSEWQRVLDRVREIGIPHIILTGGEPTLHPHLVDLVRYAEERGHIVGMNSNGRRLAQRALTQALADAGLDHVQITLESCRPEVHDSMVLSGGAWQETVQGIRNAVACGLHTITNTTLTRRNQDHAVETVDFVHSLGLDTFAMNGMIYAGGGVQDPYAIPSEEMAALLTAVRDRADHWAMQFLWYTVTDYCRFSPLELGLAPKRCNAAEYSMCIEPNGDVLPCQSYYVSAGNILKDSWESIWNSALFLSFRQRGKDPQAAGLPEACWDCPDMEMCGGGCRLEHETQAGIRAAEHGCARARLSAAKTPAYDYAGADARI